MATGANLRGVIDVIDVGGDGVAVSGLDGFARGKVEQGLVVDEVVERGCFSGDGDGLAHTVAEAGAEGHGGHVGITLGTIASGGAGTVG